MLQKKARVLDILDKKSQALKIQIEICRVQKRPRGAETKTCKKEE